MPSPFSFLKSLSSRSEKAIAGPSSGSVDRRVSNRSGKGKLRKQSIGHAPASRLPVISHPIEIPVAVSRSKASLGHPPQSYPLDQIPIHPSIPPGSLEAWRAFPPPYRAENAMLHNREVRDSVMPEENPEVSRYYSGISGAQYPQFKGPQPMPPSRSWSPIPTVHRESFPDGSFGQPHRSLRDEDVITTTSSRREEFPFRQITNSRQSNPNSMATIGRQPSEHELRYIEYPATPVVNHHPGLVYPTHSQHDENTPRRVPLRETIEPAIFEHNEWGDPDSEPEVYHYIVPVGLDVIFQDEDGTEITRVGKLGMGHHRRRPVKSVPIVVHDDFGKELYRDPPPIPQHRPPRQFKGKIGSPLTPGGAPHSAANHHSPWEPSPPGSNTSSRSMRTIIVDEKGNQMPVKSTSIPRDGTTRIIHSPALDISYQVHVDHA